MNTESRIKKISAILVFLAIVFFMVFLNQKKSDLILFVSFGLLVCVVLYETNTNNIYIIVFLLPFLVKYRLSFFDVSLISILSIVIAIKYFFLFFKTNLTFPFPIFMFFISLLSVELGTLLLGDWYGLGTLIKNFSWILLLIYFISLLFNDLIDASYRKLVFSHASGLALSVLITLPEAISYFGISYRDRYTACYNDPNAFSLAVCFSIANLLTLHLTTRKSIYFASSLIFSLIGFLSLSKTYLLVLLFLFLIYFLFVIFYRRIGFAKIFSIVGIIIIFFFIFQATIINYYQLYINRFEYSSNFSSGRFDLWISYWSVITSNVKIFLFGLGKGAYQENYNLNVAHNSYLQLLISWGIFGVLLILLIISWSYTSLNNSKNCKKKLFSYFPIITFIIYISSLDLFQSIIFSIYFYISINAIFNNQEAKNI